MAALSPYLESLDLSHDPTNRATTNATNEFASFAADEPSDTLTFYTLEAQLLALWDQLNELKLEKALLQAQLQIKPSAGKCSHTPCYGLITDCDCPAEEPAPNNEDTFAELKAAERECLEARASYMLKQSVVEDVLIAEPILNAVHGGHNATATERYRVPQNLANTQNTSNIYIRTLAPLLDRRDILSIASTNLTRSLSSIQTSATKTAAANLTLANTNKDLASQLLTLTAELRTRKQTACSNPQFSAGIAKQRDEASIAMKRWRSMKSVVAAIVTGSGVDWARDEGLRELVLDDEDEGG